MGVIQRFELIERVVSDSGLPYDLEGGPPPCWGYFWSVALGESLVGEVGQVESLPVVSRFVGVGGIHGAFSLEGRAFQNAASIHLL